MLKKKPSITERFARSYNPSVLSPLEYARKNYSDELVKDLTGEKNKFLISGVGGGIFGFIVFYIGIRFNILAIAVAGLVIVGITGYIVPRFTSPMWLSYKKAYRRSEESLKEWEQLYGIGYGEE